MAHCRSSGNIGPTYRSLLAILLCISRLAHAGEPSFALRVLSSRADTVSGGTVLVELRVPRETRWSAWLDGRDVSRDFRLAPASGHLLALLKRLALGKNTLEIRAKSIVETKLEILNHPLAGPDFAGRQQEPFVCETVESGLGPATNKSCDAKTVVRYFYRSSSNTPLSLTAALKMWVCTSVRCLAPGFKAYDRFVAPPADVAPTVTSLGQRVNFVVRREVGVIDRAIYEIEFLHQPREPLPTPWTAPSPGWNGRLVYLFDGGCGSGYHQGTLTERFMAPMEETLLARGYAIATSSLNVFDNDCNDRTAAEVLSMVKEHFIKEFGVPVHTIGLGGSGGAMELYLIAQNYPGLLNGIIPWLSFPDILSPASMGGFTDCALLAQAFKTSGIRWSRPQKTAVSGFANWDVCKEKAAFSAPLLQSQACASAIPKALVYDAEHNRRGVRCDLYDGEINVLGRDPRTGRAYRPLDNVGVQYGLVALNRGEINTDQFIDLNRRIGGFDQNGNIVDRRTVADTPSLVRVYQSGLILTGGGGLRQIPIIDWRPYLDDIDTPTADHVEFETFATRARLEAADGDANNQVVLTDPRVGDWEFSNPEPTSPITRRLRWLVQQMDHWLGNITIDHAAGNVRQRVVRDKPKSLADGCWSANGRRITESSEGVANGRCLREYPIYGDPRIAAGGPIADDIVKCALKPIDPRDYAHILTAQQFEALRSIFPNGVCDYGGPGAGQQVTENTWQRYDPRSLHGAAVTRRGQSDYFKIGAATRLAPKYARGVESR